MQGTNRNLSDLLHDVPKELFNDVRQGLQTLKQYEMADVRARVCAVIDISRSMENPNKFISSGALVSLFNKFFSLGILFDDNEEIEVFFLGDDRTDYGMRKFSKAEFNRIKEARQFTGFIESIFMEFLTNGCGLAETTHYDKPIKKIIDHYFPLNERAEWKYNDPVFCAFLTDGNPTGSSGLRAKGLIAKAADEGMPIFFKFLALTGAENKFTLLKEIDDDPERLFDNTDFIEVNNPDLLIMADLINEFRGFILECNYRKLLASSYDIPGHYLDQENRRTARDRPTSFFPPVLGIPQQHFFPHNNLTQQQNSSQSPQRFFPTNQPAQIQTTQNLGGHPPRQSKALDGCKSCVCQ